MIEPRDFYLLSINNRPLMLVPRAPRPVRIGATKCYPAFTRKRRVFRGLLQCYMGAGFPIGRTLNKCYQPIAVEQLNHWLVTLDKELELREWYPIFIWPADPDRGRVYSFILDQHGKAQAFAKFALNKKNSSLIENEVKALITIGDSMLPYVRIPHVLAAGEGEEGAYQLQEFIPQEKSERIQILSLQEVFRVVRGETRMVTAEEIKLRPWWKNFYNQKCVSSHFIECVQEAMTEGVCVGRVHGDMNRTNISVNKNNVCIMDWEHSDEVGPCLTDQLALILDCLWGLLKKKPSSGLYRFQLEHWKSRDKSYRNAVTMALAFLVGAEFTPAIILVREWYGEIKSYSTEVLRY